MAITTNKNTTTAQARDLARELRELDAAPPFELAVYFRLRAVTIAATLDALADENALHASRIAAVSEIVDAALYLTDPHHSRMCGIGHRMIENAPFARLKAALDAYREAARMETHDVDKR